MVQHGHGPAMTGNCQISMSDSQIALIAVELGQHAILIARSDDFDAQRPAVFSRQYGQFRRKAPADAVAVVHQKCQFIGPVQPETHGKHACAGQKQRQEDKQHDLRGVADAAAWHRSGRTDIGQNNRLAALETSHAAPVPLAFRDQDTSPVFAKLPMRRASAISVVICLDGDWIRSPFRLGF